MYHLLGRQLSIAYEGQHVISGIQCILGQHILKLVRFYKTFELKAMPLQLLVKDFPPQCDALFPFLRLYPVFYLRYCPRCNDAFQPVLTGIMTFLSNYLHGIPIFQLIFQRHYISVYLGSDTLISYIRMDAVGKIYGGRASGEGFNIAGGSKDIDIFGIEGEF